MMRTLLFTMLFVCCAISALAQTRRDTISLKVEFKENAETGQYSSAILTLKNETEDMDIALGGKWSVDDGGDYYAVVGMEAESMDGRIFKGNVACFYFEGKAMWILKPKQQIVQRMPFFSQNAGADFFPFNNVSKLNLKRIRVRLVSPYGGINTKDHYTYRPTEGICSDWIDLTGPKFDFLRK